MTVSGLGAGVSDRLVWQLELHGKVIGHVRWLRGREVVTDLAGPFGRMVESWFSQSVHKIPSEEIDFERASAFFEEQLPPRFEHMRVRALVPGTVPAAARWLVVLDDDRIPPIGKATPFAWARNRWQPDLSVSSLVADSLAAQVQWTRGSAGGFKAGGRCPDATEMWLTLAWCGDRYVLVPRQRRRMWGPPLVQRARWWKRPELHRLWRFLDGEL